MTVTVKNVFLEEDGGKTLFPYATGVPNILTKNDIPGCR